MLRPAGAVGNYDSLSPRGDRPAHNSLPPSSCTYMDPRPTPTGGYFDPAEVAAYAAPARAPSEAMYADVPAADPNPRGAYDVLNSQRSPAYQDPSMGWSEPMYADAKELGTRDGISTSRLKSDLDQGLYDDASGTTAQPAAEHGNASTFFRVSREEARAVPVYEALIPAANT